MTGKLGHFELLGIKLEDFHRFKSDTVDGMSPKDRKKAELCVDCVHYGPLHTHDGGPDKKEQAMCDAARYRDPVTGDEYQLHARDWRAIRTKPNNQPLEACQDFKRKP